MIAVNIAVLKAKLSFYLGQVKQGNEILVMDRDTPVARMLPSVGRARGLVLVKAKKSPACLKAMKFRAVKRRTSSVELLREERDRR
jgi:antitoxin (DNA-binding transcriptional repressor) of toxin-antitoxin stability system